MGGHVDDKKETAQSKDEITIDFKKAGTFVKKHALWFTLLLVLLLQFVPNHGFAPCDGKVFCPWGGMWMRMQSKDMHVTDDWAINTVQNNVRQQLRSVIDQQYPNLPDNRKGELVEQELQTYVQTNKAEIDQQIQQLSAQFRSFYQYEYNGQQVLYMPDIDPYFFLRYARNIQEKGHYYDELRDGVKWDTHMVAPLGREALVTLHPLTLLTTYKFMRMFKDVDLMQGAAYFPIIFILLSLIPAFFIGRRIAGNVGGFVTATIIAISPAIMGRTPWGHADSDAYNTFFPLLITWLFLEMIAAKETWKKYSFAGATGFAVFIHSLYWGGWFITLDFIGAAIAATIIILIITDIVKTKKFRVKALVKDKKLQQLVLGGLLILAVAGIGYSFVNGVGEFGQLVLSPASYGERRVSAVGTDIWPNVGTTVAEMNLVPFAGVISTVGGGVIVFIALLGGLMLLTKSKWTRGSLLLIWLIGSIYGTTKSIRISLILAPAVALGWGAAVGISWEVISQKIKKFKYKRTITTIAAVLIILILSIIMIKPTGSAFFASRNDVPIVHDAWWNILTKINNESQEDAILNSWWDFGHHFKYISDRKVTFDGSTQTLPMAHWIGRTLLTSDENEARGILRMLDCGSFKGVEELQKSMPDSVNAVMLAKEIILLNNTDAQAVLEEKGVTNIDDVLALTHCDAPENYFITSEDMIGKSSVWAHFGGWDFERAWLWRNKAKPQAELLARMQNDFGYDEEKAIATYNNLQTLLTEDQANGWISPWPGYVSQTISPCSQSGNTISCGNGLTFDMVAGTASITTPQGSGTPYSVVFINSEAEFIELDLNDTTVPFSAAIYPTLQGGIASVLMSPELSTSMFTRLYFFQGHGLEYLRHFETQGTISGGWISSWKVNWAGDEPQVVFSMPEPTVTEETDEPAETNAIKVNYLGWFDDGEVFDSSIINWQEQGITKDSAFDDFDTNPLAFTLGAGQVIEGFNGAAANLAVGQETTVKLPPELAYGTDPNAHPLGNKTLNFKIQRVE